MLKQTCEQEMAHSSLANHVVLSITAAGKTSFLNYKVFQRLWSSTP